MAQPTSSTPILQVYPFPRTGYSKQEKREKYDQINLDFFVPFVKELMKSNLCKGCHIMSVHYTELIPKLLKEVQVLPEPAVSVVST